MGIVTPENLSIGHIKAARALLEWTAADLAEASSISVATIRNYESGKEVRNTSKQAMIDAVEEGGIKLYNGKRPGVRMRAGPD